jgi:hypothetical protein
VNLSKESLQIPRLSICQRHLSEIANTSLVYMSKTFE